MILSDNAQKLLTFLKDSGPKWEQDCIKALFPEPKYIKDNAEAQTAYWQWDCNLYGNNYTRPVLGKHILFTATQNYSSVICAAYQELKKAGLAGESNNGYNEYVFFAK